MAPSILAPSLLDLQVLWKELCLPHFRAPNLCLAPDLGCNEQLPLPQSLQLVGWLLSRYSRDSHTVSVVYRPLDFVGTFSNRWSYGVAFGATANKVMFLFSEGYQPLKVPQWAQGTRPASHMLRMSPGRTCPQRPWGRSGGINSVSSHILLSLLLAQNQCLVAYKMLPSLPGGLLPSSPERCFRQTAKAQEVESSSPSSASPPRLLPSNSSSFWGSSSRDGVCSCGHWPEASLPRFHSLFKGATLTYRFGELSYNSRTFSPLHRLLLCSAGAQATPPGGCSILCLLGMGCHWLPCLCPRGRMNVPLLQLISDCPPDSLPHFTVNISKARTLAISALQCLALEHPNTDT